MTLLPEGDGVGGGHCLFIYIKGIGTQNKTTDSRFSATTAVSHCPRWFTAPCFQGIKGQTIVTTVVTAVVPHQASLFSFPDTNTLEAVIKTLIKLIQGAFLGLDKPKTTAPQGSALLITPILTMLAVSDSPSFSSTDIVYSHSS